MAPLESIPEQIVPPESMTPQATPNLGPPLTLDQLEALGRSKVIIAGAGLAGLTLGILLQKANIPFHVFEKSREFKPLGAAIVLGSSVAPLYHQLSIFDEFVARAKRYTGMGMYTENLKLVHTMDNTPIEKALQYQEYVISRTDLHDLLLSHVPKERIHMGKRIESFDQSKENITVRFTDDTTYQGDILVGADGAYSAVRRHMYQALKEKSTLPTTDEQPLPFDCVCLVGQTTELDPEEFPEVNVVDVPFNSVLGGERSRCTWTVFITKQKKVCWMVIKFLRKDELAASEVYRSRDWGADAAEAMCKEVRGFKVPGGKSGQQTLGDYIDRTPKECIGKVRLEEIVFETWFNGRAVLIGDACHKMGPASGIGTLVAMHDAVTLANWISTLQMPAISDLEHVFNEYRAERYPIAKEALKRSQFFTKAIGRYALTNIIRGVLKKMPGWLWRRTLLKMCGQRPQASFLPLITEPGKVKAQSQPSMKKTRAIHRELANAREEAEIQATIVVTI
ncbi:hypothetical protein BG005_010495 [Podila minutissima]|nr:hypothetical protein BG005_010495 [Podila minutissima]